MQTAIWKQKTLTDCELHQVRQLVANTRISPLLAKLYIKRGLLSQEQIDAFLAPDGSSLHSPFLYLDMDKAVKRLNQAVSAKEKILIYGDYDVDGTTSIALVYRYLSNYYTNIGFYVPNRETEGYGVSVAGVDFARENNYSLVIALDCGIKDAKTISYAKTVGIDFIVCDHHNPDEHVPDAVAVLDAKRDDNTYPYSELSGCGVGYKLMQAFAQANGYSEETLEPLLDLLAMSIASDIVPLTGENRALLIRGLKRINTNPSVGVKAIIANCELTLGEIGISDLVFQIGPRINASGRMDSADEAVKLLIATDEADAQKHFLNINASNEKRREFDLLTTQQALAQIEADAQYKFKSSTVVFNPEWKKGVVGIVASRLIEKYYKPTIVLTESSGIISGSARSVSDFDLYSAIKACADDLIAFGGHDFAAGLSMKPDKLDDFKRHFEQYVSSNITEQQKLPLIQYDAEISFSDITPAFFSEIKRLEPFGPENEQPVFVTRGVYNIAASRLVGQTQEHLRLEVSDGSIRDKMIGIAFNKKEFYQPLSEGRKIDICYTLEENVFRGRRSIQLHVKDIKLTK